MIGAMIKFINMHTRGGKAPECIQLPPWWYDQLFEACAGVPRWKSYVSEDLARLGYENFMFRGVWMIPDSSVDKPTVMAMPVGKAA